WIERDRGPAFAGKLRHRDALCPRPDGQPERVSLDRCPAQLGERLVDDALEVRVRAGQEVVLGLLEARACPRDRRVADEVREQPLRGVAAEVDGLPGLGALAAI